MTQTVPDQQRATFIAGLHEFADYLAANPWLPIDRDNSGYVGPARVQVDLHGEHEDATAETISRVREIAAQLGVKVDDKARDRTSADVKIGSVSYSLIAWHKNGRPDEADERDVELERLRAEVAALRGVEVAKATYITARCGDLDVHGPHVVDHGPDQPRNCPGVQIAVDKPRAPFDQDAEDAAAFDRGFMAEHRRAAEAATLSAAIRFSEARREAFRLTGRTTSERLLAATFDLLHGQALDEDAERARRADLREGEHGRITSPDLARFLAKKEEKRRAVHYLDYGSDGDEDDQLACGSQVREVAKYTDDFAKVTCSVCSRAMAPVSEAR